MAQKTLNCTQGEGEVGVNLTANAINRIGNCMPLTVGQAQVLAKDGRKAGALANFLESNGCSTEAKLFAEVAIDAWQNDGEVAIEDKIINNLTGKAKCVYDKLQKTNLTEPGIVQQTYIAFNPNLNYLEHFVSYEQGILPSSITGRTTIKSPKYFAITLNKDRIDNRSSIEVARTILHESIHALLMKHMNSGVESFIEIFKDYLKVDDIHHAIIADKYIAPMAASLKKFDGGMETDSYYEYLAWDGIPLDYRNPKITDSMINSAILKFRSRGLGCN